MSSKHRDKCNLKVKKFHSTHTISWFAFDEIVKSLDYWDIKKHIKRVIAMNALRPNKEPSRRVHCETKLKKVGNAAWKYYSAQVIHMIYIYFIIFNAHVCRLKMREPREVFPECCYVNIFRRSFAVGNFWSDEGKGRKFCNDNFVVLKWKSFIWPSPWSWRRENKVL